MSPAKTAADETQPPPPVIDPKILDEAGERMVEAFSLILKAIPQYELPEILPNGDIIIRRVPPDQKRPPNAIPPDQDRT